jgi:sodium-dependent phosphate transporter
VGSRTVALWCAVCLAAVFSFVGSLTLGGHTTKAIAGSIANTATFAKEPAVFMFGMYCATVGSLTWVLLATYLGLPVSTTHSTGGQPGPGAAAARGALTICGTIHHHDRQPLTRA